MKTIPSLLLLAASFLSTSPGPDAGHMAQSPCLGQADAERILGQPASSTDSSSEIGEGVTKFRCTYTADAPDASTNKLGHVYYMLEEYASAEASSGVYRGFFQQNRSMPGFEVLDGFADQAFQHSDRENFLLIISRKGTKILRLKVNKLTSRTSEDAFREVAKTLTASL